ncbi:MAG: hypothetical protein ACTSRW_02470 [Candidatus Helarchaeota archaeon]
MEQLEKLGEWPSVKLIKALVLLSLALIFIIYPIMGLFFTLSGFSTSNIISSQLSFSGSILKAMYIPVVLSGGLFFYQLSQTIDYIFMFSYGLLIFNLALVISRAFEESSFWRKSGYVIALFGIIAPSLDAIENAFILLTLTNPLGFPDWWAVAHSCFALPKWLFIMVALLWAIIAAIILLVKKIRS